jgi:hypothetical protein
VAVARSRQVCIYWLWKHCLLLSFYLRDEQILIDIGNMDRRIVLPIPSFSWSCLAEPLPVQLNCTNVRMYEPANSNRNTAYSQQPLPQRSTFYRLPDMVQPRIIPPTPFPTHRVQLDLAPPPSLRNMALRETKGRPTATSSAILVILRCKRNWTSCQT